MKKIVVANWKMNKSHAESIKWVEICGERLQAGAAEADVTAVLCPTFTALDPVAHLISSKKSISLGAQDCSVYASGNHTGGVSVLSLKEIGCTYCIIGHSESRRELCQDDATIAKKVELLLEHKIIPVVCIGEPEEHMSVQDIWAHLERQLVLIFNSISERSSSHKPLLYIAYEPHWAISSGKTPSVAVLIDVIARIKKFAAATCPATSVGVLYGGSTTVQTAENFKKIKHLDGFLVGGASLKIDSFLGIINF